MGKKDDLIYRKDTSIPLWAKALMVLVAIVTLVAVWLVPDKKEQAPPALPEIPAPPQADKEMPLPPLGDESTAIVHEGDKARVIITRLRTESVNPDLDEIFSQAEQLQSERQLADAYLLYRFAARKGHAQAALILGSQADPAFYTAETSILPSPDPLQAYKWYRVAAAAGDEEAEERLQNLRDRIEQSAAGGNESARRLMLQWH